MDDHRCGAGLGGQLHKRCRTTRVGNENFVSQLRQPARQRAADEPVPMIPIFMISVPMLLTEAVLASAHHLHTLASCQENQQL